MDIDSDDGEYANILDAEVAQQPTGSLMGVMSDSDDDDDDDAGRVVTGVIGATVSNGPIPMEEEDDEQEQIDDEDDYDDAMDLDGDYVTMAKEVWQELKDMESNAGLECDAWEIVQPLLYALDKLCDFSDSHAPMHGGINVIFLAEEPTLEGRSAPHNMCYLIRSNRYTHRPRYAVLAHAFQAGMARNLPGSVEEKDIRALKEDYDKRSKQSMPAVGMKTRQALMAICNTLKKGLTKFEIPFALLVQTDKYKFFCGGYSKTYPLINLTMAACSCRKVSEITTFLRERRRSLKDHSEDDFDELEQLINDMYDPN